MVDLSLKGKALFSLEVDLIYFIQNSLNIYESRIRKKCQLKIHNAIVGSN